MDTPTGDDLLKAILDSSPSFMHVLRGPRFIFEYANDSYYRLVGRRELIGRPAFEVMPEAAAGGFQERIAQVMQTRQPFHGKELPVELVREAGGAPERRLVDLVYIPLIASDGSCDRVVGHGTDVTDYVMARRDAERQARETNHRLFEALHTAKMASWEWSTETNVMSASSGMSELYRLPSKQHATPADWQAALHPESRETHAAMVQRAALAGESWHTELRLHDDQGRQVWLEERAYCVIDEYTGTRRVSGLVWDISERKLQELELREADRRKNDFLATLAHELRNPLAPISNGLEILKLAAPDIEAIVPVRKMMERQLTHIVRLVDDLLEISRITRGKIELRKSRLLIGSVLSAAIEAAWPRFQEKSITLETQLDGAFPIDADHDRLIQVYANLLFNAAKFTPAGGSVWISAKAEGSDLVVSVRDNGCGIAADRLESIFEMFVQGARHEAVGGLGIGLALVRQMVQLHGGTVTARSDGPGSGSEFIVRLPLPDGDSVHGSLTDADPEPSLQVQPRSVMVVDDNADAADSLAEGLRMQGHEVEVAYDGESALAACERQMPSVLILDIGMPGLDGYDVARTIHARWPGSHGPCLAALSGWGQPEDKQRAADAGFHYHFTKPVDFGELLSKLNL